MLTAEPEPSPRPVHARPARPDDVAAITQLQRRWDTAWFGSPENDESEVRESFDRVDPLEDRSRVLVDDAGELLAAAWWWAPNETTLLVEPSYAPGPFHENLVRWLASSGATGVEALSRDVAMLEALARLGWHHDLSSFELIREVSPDWVLAEPVWPDDVVVSTLTAEDDEEAHRVVYDGARWADVPGHEARGFEEWRSLFVGDDVPRDQQLLVRREGRAVGVAVGRTFSDGTGWVSQLAVSAEAQGQGLGRALLLGALRLRASAGARQLGLGVSGKNVDALRLYLDVGLTVDREWMHHRPS